MSTSPVFISLKLAMKAKIKEDTKLKKDTVTNLCRDIYHMQTLSEAMLFIDLNDLVIDTTNLQEDFDAEQRAAATSSLLPSMDPAEIASKGRHTKEGAARVTTPCPDILSGGPTAIGAPSKLDVTADAVIVIIRPAAADPLPDHLPDPPDPLSGDTVDAAPIVAPMTDAATMAMPCARHDVSPVDPTPPPDPFLTGFFRDANPGLSPWPCFSVPRSVCPAAPNYAEKPDFARLLCPYRGI
jgi:hypothetical protein